MNAASLPVLHQTCVGLWHSTPATLPALGPHVPWHRQWTNARAASALIDEVAKRITTYPIDNEERSAWRTSVRQRLLSFGEQRLSWPATYRGVVFDDGFCETAVGFSEEARRFDASLPIEDLGQALRNVWVGNSLQILLGMPVRLTPALFSYSMLYPTTDNVLDALDRSNEAKRSFNDRLGRRLAGGMLPAGNLDERRVWALLDTIEGEFPRRRFPGVWHSLIDIHHAQCNSLKQHGSHLSDRELLDLTIAKGGSSVRADVYVIAGIPDPASEELAFLYGVFLQMLDDLQDIDADLAAGHETLFTRASQTGELDTLTRRLARFIERVMAPHAASTDHAVSSCAEVIRRNCLMLVVGVIARHPQQFGRELRKEVERQWPMRLRATRRLLRHGQQQIARARALIRQQHGTDSVVALLLQRG